MRHRALAALVLASLAVASLGAPVSAKPPAKVAVCHYDAVTQTYNRIEIPQNAVDAHMRHGDGLPGAGNLDATCQLVVGPPRVFVRAFRNDDGQPGFNPATDFVYNEFVDTNRDNTPDAGDTVQVHAYPTDFSGGTMTVGVSEFVATSVNVLSGTIAVSVGTIGFNWTTNNAEAFIELGSGDFSTMGDLQTAGQLDLIKTSVTSPSAPAAAIDVTTSSETNDAWLDVTITP